MKRALLTLTAAAAILATAMPLAAPAHHEPGHEGGDDEKTDLTIAAAPSPVLWSDATTITGRLKGRDHDGATIELQYRPHPFTDPYRVVSTTVTNDDGDYSFTIAPARHTIYRTVVQAEPDKRSPELLMGVRMRINRGVSDRTPRRGQRVRFFGAVAPAHDGHPIQIQRRGSDGVYRTVATTRLTDAGERYSTNSFYGRRVRVRRDGRYRVVVPADADHGGNTTASVRLDVR
jgi:hypothetical protein